MLTLLFLSYLFVASAFFFSTIWILSWLWLKGPNLSRFDEPRARRVTDRQQPSDAIADVHQLLSRLRDNVGPVGSRGRLQRLRRAFDEGFSAASRDPVALGVEVRSCDADGVPAEWVLAPGAAPDRRLLYLHGGAFMVGSPESHRPLTAALARKTGASVLAVDYRLMPENPRRACIEDCQTAYHFVLENGPDGPAPVAAMAVAGDSAGGNLTLMLTAWARDQGLRPVEAALALSPATDSTLSSPTLRENVDTDVMLGPLFRPMLRAPRTVVRFWTLVGNRMHPANPLISPLHGDLSGLPPTLVQASESEILLGDAARYVNRARAAGSPVELQTWPGMVHVWQIFGGVLPEADEALDELVRFVTRAWHASETGHETPTTSVASVRT